MLFDILKNRKCFKLICAAGNEDEKEIEKLCAVYSLAGASFFDVAAKKEVILAAKKGLKRAQELGQKEERFLCASLATDGDKHINKAFIEEKNCINCKKCISSCPSFAIEEKNIEKKTENKVFINKARCIGCEKCLEICPKKAIKMLDGAQDFSAILPEIAPLLDCIEFHTLSKDEKEIEEKWALINSNFKGMLSICLDRSKIGNEDTIKRISRMIKDRTPYSTIIQADGAPMSGGKDDFKTTLQAVAMGEIIQRANLPVFILLSGGTNSKTTELAKLCEIKANGVSIGSYARKIVFEYIKDEDFFENKEKFLKAVKIARNLVETSLKNLA